MTQEWKEIEGIIRFAKSDYAVEEVKKYIEAQRKSLLEEIRGMNKKPKLEPGNMQDFYRVGYNQALDDVISQITTQQERGSK